MTAGDARWVVGAIVIASVSGCGDPPPLRIGIVMAGEAVEAARFAAAEINASHGIGGRPLVVRAIVDGGSQARSAIAAAESLSTDPTVIGVVGHSNSAASLAAAQLYNARKVVQIAPTSSAGSLSEAGPYTYRLVASDTNQARFIADEILRVNPAARPAIIYVNDDYGRSLHKELHAHLTGRGIHVPFELSYVENAPLIDVEDIVSGIASSGAKELVWLGRNPQLRQLLPVLRRSVPGISVLGSDAVDSREAEKNQDGVLTGVQYVCFVDMHGSRPQIAVLQERFGARTKSTMTAEMALTYDAVMLIATAAREAGASRGSVRDYLNSLGRTRPAFHGATGDIAFDSNGDPLPSYCLGEITATGVRVLRGANVR
jgi:branched-chain amino acid transport system substrate-binding protein